MNDTRRARAKGRKPTPIEKRQAEYQKARAKRAARPRKQKLEDPLPGVRELAAWLLSDAFLAIVRSFKRSIATAKRSAAENALRAVWLNSERGNSDSSIRLKANPERYAIEIARWRAKGLMRKCGKQMVDDGTVTDDVIASGDCCLYCNERLNARNRTIDHMDPLSVNGIHSATNIAPCCHSCNSSKGAKSFASFIARLDDNVRVSAIKFYRDRKGIEQAGDPGKMHDSHHGSTSAAFI